MINREESAVKFDISCERKVLLEALKFANSFVPSRATHPILAGVLLKAENNSLTIETCDLSQGCKITIPATVNIASSTVVLCRDFLSLLNNFVGDTIDIFLVESSKKTESTLLGSPTDYDLVMQLGKQNASLATLPPTEYPNIFEIKSEHSINLETTQLVQALERTSYTASKDDTKQVLCGLNLTSKTGGLTFAGTNGHHLAFTSVDGHYDPSLSVTIPVNFWGKLQKLLKDVESVTFEIGKNAVQATLTTILAKEVIVDVCLHGSILEGTFPNFDKLVPADFSRRVKAPRQELLQALGLIGVCIPEVVAASETCVFDIKEDEILITKSGTSIKTVEQVVKSDILAGEPITIGLNHVYLKNILNSFSSTDVIFYLNQANNPVVIKGFDEPLESTALLMPVQLR
jgi:DNA polymerase-3 subunit beta